MSRATLVLLGYMSTYPAAILATSATGVSTYVSSIYGFAATPTRGLDSQWSLTTGSRLITASTTSSGYLTVRARVRATRVRENMGLSLTLS